jgi:glycosyltransferase involved in cell wall biosynthesis
MKVLIAGYLLGQGGIQSHLKWLARALGEAEIETLVVSLGDRHPSPIDLESFKKHQSKNVNFVCCDAYKEIGNPLLSKLLRLRYLTDLIREFSPHVYLAVGTGWNLFIPPLLSNTKARLIFHEVMSGVPTGWQDSRWLVRWGFDEVVGQSPVVAQTFAECFHWHKPIAAIPAIPEPLEITATLPQVTPKTVELGQAKAALFSRLVPHKQAFWLVQQWDSLKDVLSELHIHGAGPEEPLIREYIAAKGLDGRVKCFGRYPEGQAYVDLLSQYDLTLLPTIGAEGAPLVLLESMACGVPFVAYGVGGIPDYGIDNPNVLVVPLGPKSFISGIRQTAQKLANGQVNQAQLQQFYLEHYSYIVLKQAWMFYLLKMKAN